MQSGRTEITLLDRIDPKVDSTSRTVAADVDGGIVAEGQLIGDVSATTGPTSSVLCQIPLSCPVGKANPGSRCGSSGSIGDHHHSVAVGGVGDVDRVASRSLSDTEMSGAADPG